LALFAFHAGEHIANLDAIEVSAVGLAGYFACGAEAVALTAIHAYTSGNHFINERHSAAYTPANECYGIGPFDLGAVTDALAAEYALGYLGLELRLLYAVLLGKL
jgi:hypothetical protein